MRLSRGDAGGTPPVPELVGQAGAVVARFPTGETAIPRVVGMDLTPRQREILVILAQAPEWAHSHDLGACAERVAERAGEPPSSMAQAIARLEPLVSVARYPSGDVSEPIPADLIDEGRARAAVADAEEVLGWVKQLVQSPPGRAKRTSRS